PRARRLGPVEEVWSGPGRLIDDVRRHLERSLPNAMIPSAFVTLPALPLSPNGKVDRRALPEPERRAGAGFVAPREEVERRIAAIWSQVLGIEQVGVEDSFFDLGGHSLLAMQVVSRIRDAFLLDLPVRQLFEQPTVAALARAVVKARESGQCDADPALHRSPRDRRLPLSFAQQRLWFLDQLDPHSAAYNLPALFDFDRALDLHCLRRALAEILRRHEALRTTFALLDGTPVQVISPAAEIEIPLEDLTRDPDPQHREARAAERTEETLRRPFDLQAGPLLRARLFRLAPDHDRLLLVFHHIVADGWSLGILRRELSELLEAFRAGRPSPLPDLPIQYADY